MGKNNTNANDMIVGLDIGTTKIATVVGYRNENGQIEVIGHGLSESTGVEFGEIRNINRTVDGIIKSKDIAEQRANCEIKNVYVGIAGHHIKTSKYNHHLYRYNNKTPISQEEIDNLKEEIFKVVVPPGEKIIDVIPQRYFIDNVRETFEPVGELGNEIIGTYQLITGKESEIERILLCGDNASLTLNEIILEPIASGLACLSEEEKQRGVVLVDIGGGTTDMIVFIDGSPVFTKVIPIGGNVVTRDIAQVCKISMDVAEQLKVKHGTCVVDKSNANNFITIPKGHGLEPIQINENYLSQIIHCRVQEEILNTIKQEIENSGYRDKLYAGLVLTGGGSNLRHIKELCEYTLQMDTRIGIPEYGFSRTISTDLKQPAFATALGLLKYGIETEEHSFGRSDNANHNADNNNGSNGIFSKSNNGNGGNNSSSNNSNESKWGFMSKVHDWMVTLLDRMS